MVGRLAAIPGLECVVPEGAFYAFPRVEPLYERKKTAGSVEFCRRMLEEAHVAAVPGEAFGVDACVRFSFVTPTGRIEEGLRRFEEWLGREG